MPAHWKLCQSISCCVPRDVSCMLMSWLAVQSTEQASGSDQNRASFESIDFRPGRSQKKKVPVLRTSGMALVCYRLGNIVKHERGYPDIAQKRMGIREKYTKIMKHFYIHYFTIIRFLMDNPFLSSRYRRNDKLYHLKLINDYLNMYFFSVPESPTNI